MVKLVRKKPIRAEFSKVTVDCSQAQADNIIDPAGLEQFFVEKFKFDGKTGNFEKKDRSGNVTKNVVVSRNGGVISIESRCINKRYVKTLTKKYLCKQQIKEFLRVIATSREGVTLKYYASVKAAGAA